MSCSPPHGAAVVPSPCNPLTHPPLRTGGNFDYELVPLLASIQAQHPITCVDGLPGLQPDLSWAEGVPLYVIMLPLLPLLLLLLLLPLLLLLVLLLLLPLLLLLLHLPLLPLLPLMQSPRPLLLGILSRSLGVLNQRPAVREP